MKNVLIICVGNICRSPMGEGLLAHYSEKHQLGLNVSSAGLSAMVGHPADSNAIVMMQKQGIDISQHLPRQLTEELLAKADLTLVMEAWQQQEIGCLFPSAYGKVHRIGRWGDFDVPDPYKKSHTAFEEAYSLIEKGLREWQNRLWRKHV